MEMNLLDLQDAEPRLLVLDARGRSCHTLQSFRQQVHCTV